MMSQLLDPRTVRVRARILAILTAKPSTPREISDQIYQCIEGVINHLRRMQEEKPRLVYISGWVYNPKGRPRPLYAAGDKKDVVYVKTKAPFGRLFADDRKAQIVKMLARHNYTTDNIAERLFLSKPSVRNYLLELRNEKKVRIAAWISKSCAPPVPVYGIGGEPDQPRPELLTSSERSSRYWAKIKSNPHRHQIFLMLQRARRKPQGWIGALTHRPRAALEEMGEP